MIQWKKIKIKISWWTRNREKWGKIIDTVFKCRRRKKEKVWVENETISIPLILIDAINIASIPFCLSMRTSISLSVLMSIYISVRMSKCLSVRMSICLSVRMYFCLSVQTFICLSFWTSIYLSIKISICLSVFHQSVCYSEHISIYLSNTFLSVWMFICLSF